MTHAWAEGIYEFLDKLLASWPPGGTGAYVCFLANPQTADVASLLASPAESPFARALAASRVVVVVANRRCSIYSRLWCVYEAFLASKSDKELYVAVVPVLGRLPVQLPSFVFAYCVGAALAAALAWGPPFDPDRDGVPLAAVASAAAALLPHGRGKWTASRCAATAAVLTCAGLARLGPQSGWACEVGAWMARGAWLLLPLLSECERLRSEQLGHEGGLLAYQGSARGQQPRSRLRRRGRR